MLKMTTDNLRALLADPGEQPVLYVHRDEVTGKPDRLQVWVEAYVPHDDIVLRKHELVDALGVPDHPDGVTDAALEHLLEGFQAEIDALEEADEIDDDACMLDGEVYPEHDFPPIGEGNECRRCGAEADDCTEPSYNGEIR